MEHKFLLKKLDTKGFRKLICKFEKLDFNIESNVKYFLEKVKVFAFNNKCFFKKFMRVLNSKPCKKYKLSEKEICKIQKGLQPFLNYISSQKEKNFNKFNKYIKKDPEFQRKDRLFKAEGGQTKENYDNLVGYFKEKLPWLRKRNGNNFTFMLADDNCVPMYNSDLGNFNNYGNYFSGSITFPNKECYSNLNFAFKNGYGKTKLQSGDILCERLGSHDQVKENLEISGISIGGAGIFGSAAFFSSEYLLELSPTADLLIVLLILVIIGAVLISSSLV